MMNAHVRRYYNWQAWWAEHEGRRWSAYAYKALAARERKYQEMLSDRT